MRYHELQPHKGGADLLVKASTKAGLIGAILSGFAEAMAPQYAQDEETAKITERPFKVEASDFSSLLLALMRESQRQSLATKEAYDDARLALVTDKKLVGELMGREVKSFGTAVVAVREGFAVQRNEHNEWQAMITLDFKAKRG
jgi:predicted acetyltransferase